jgi:hypothetical protein
VSFRVPSRSVIRRVSVCVPSITDTAEPDPAKRLDPMELQMVEDAVRSAVEDEVGVIICVKNLNRAELVVRRLVKRGIRAIGQNSKAPLNLGIDLHPDPRGPGIIATRRLPTPSSPVGLTSSPDEDAVPNESYRLYQAVVVPLSDNFTTGWDGNRYRRMFSVVTSSNEATRSQMEGRIDRANNNAPYIEYTTYFTETLRGLFAEHEVIRAKADALRDAQQSDGVGRRQYDQADRDQRRREAEEAKERARAEGARRSAGVPAALVAIHQACAILGITFVEVKSALRSTASKAKRQLNLIWHPDKWSEATHAEQAHARDFSSRVNNAYDIIHEYTE